MKAFCHRAWQSLSPKIRIALEAVLLESLAVCSWIGRFSCGCYCRTLHGRERPAAPSQSASLVQLGGHGCAALSISFCYRRYWLAPAKFACAARGSWSSQASWLKPTKVVHFLVAVLLHMPHTLYPFLVQARSGLPTQRSQAPPRHCGNSSDAGLTMWRMSKLGNFEDWCEAGTEVLSASSSPHILTARHATLTALVCKSSERYFRINISFI